MVPVSRAYRINIINVDAISLFANQAHILVKIVDFNSTPKNDPYQHMLDSGCSNTITHSQGNIAIFTLYCVLVTIATDDIFYTKSYGDMILDVTLPSEDTTFNIITIPCTWLAPSLVHNLILTHQLGDLGYCTVFHNELWNLFRMARPWSIKRLFTNTTFFASLRRL